MSAARSDSTYARAAGELTKALHDEYAKAVYRYCLRRLRSREEAEDAAQLVFLNAHRCLAAGVRPRLERAWLFTIAEHVVIYRRRTMTRRARVETPVDPGAIADVAEASPVDGSLELAGLSDALSSLPDLEQRALVLREWYGLSYREVAEELGVSNTAVERLVFRGRRALAERLDPERDARKRRGLGFSWSPWLSLKWMFGSGAVVKVVAGAASVAILATAAGRGVPGDRVETAHAAAVRTGIPFTWSIGPRPATVASRLAATAHPKKKKKKEPTVAVSTVVTGTGSKVRTAPDDSPDTPAAPADPDPTPPTDGGKPGDPATPADPPAAGPAAPPPAQPPAQPPSAPPADPGNGAHPHPTPSPPDGHPDTDPPGSDSSHGPPASPGPPPSAGPPPAPQGPPQDPPPGDGSDGSSGAVDLS